MTLTDSDQQRPHSKKILINAAILVGISGPIGVILAAFISIPMTFGDVPYPAVNPMQAALLYLVIAVLVCLFLVLAAVSPPAPNGVTTIVRIVMTALAILAPLAVVLSYRLSFETCLILNPFGLPWPDIAKLIVRVLSAAVLVGSTALIIRGFTRPQYKAASLVLTIYSVLMVIPTLFMAFLTLYGDPGGDCTVG